MISIKEVPGLMLAHQDYLRGESYRTYAGTFIVNAQEAVGEETDNKWEDRVIRRTRLGETFCNIQQSILAERVPLFVPITLLSEALTKELDLSEGAPWTPALFPARAGTLVFQDSLTFTGPEGEVSIGMVSWNWEIVEKSAAVTITAFTDSTDMRDATVAMRAEVASKDIETRNKTPHVPLGRWHMAQFGAVWSGQLAGPRQDWPIQNLARFLYTLMFLAKGKVDEGALHIYTDNRILRMGKRKTQPVPAAVFGL